MCAKIEHMFEKDGKTLQKINILKYFKILFKKWHVTVDKWRIYIIKCR